MGEWNYSCDGVYIFMMLLDMEIGALCDDRSSGARGEGGGAVMPLLLHCHARVCVATSTSRELRHRGSERSSLRQDAQQCVLCLGCAAVCAMPGVRNSVCYVWGAQQSMLYIIYHHY